jgi:phosphohistidine phosphatase SixA
MLPTMLARVLVVLLLLSQSHAQNDWAALKNGGMVLFRHAIAPGGGDPEGFALNDCRTQRNLDAAGRAQAKRIGAAFRVQKIVVGKVLTSQWCRTRETAELAFPGLPQDEPAFNSFFSDRSREAAQTRAALEILKNWRGAGVMVVVTHQVNIAALTGISPNSGEGLIVRLVAGKLEVTGRLQP